MCKPGSPKGLCTVKVVVILLGILVLAFLLWPRPLVNPMVGAKVICQSQLKGIANAIQIYEDEHDGRLPEAARWCDLLIIPDYRSPKQFICRHSDAAWGESSYAMNSAAAGKKRSELPPNMVLLFEAAQEPNDVQRDFPVASRGFVDPCAPIDPLHAKDMVCKSRWNQVCGPDRLAVGNHEGGACILFADLHVEFVKTKKLPSLRWTLDDKSTGQ
jgi:hypothetical protein